MVQVVRPAGAVSVPGGVSVCGRGQRTSARFAARGGPFCAPAALIFWRIFMSLVVVFHQASEIVPVADEFTVTNEGEAALFVELPDVDLDELP